MNAALIIGIVCALIALCLILICLKKFKNFREKYLLQRLGKSAAKYNTEAQSVKLFINRTPMY